MTRPTSARRAKSSALVRGADAVTAIIRWRSDPCGHCGVPMRSALLLLVASYRRTDNGIAFVDPPIVKVCSRECLEAWLSAHPPDEATV